ncbi:MAG: hypothetical protein FMJ08_06320 [Halomonas sp.]|nr:MAG: hypothetical protein FMJ08_06320 [Halomonas sp.]
MAAELGAPDNKPVQSPVEGASRSDGETPAAQNSKTDPSTDTEVDELRRQVQALEDQNFSLQRQTETQSNWLNESPEEAPGSNFDQASSWNTTTPETGTPEADQRIAAQMLSPVHESEGQRNLRDMLARQQGGEPVDFEANAIRSIPLMCSGPEGGPPAPIMDIWTVEPHYLAPDDLRLQVNLMAQGLARWAGFCRPDDDFYPVSRSNEGIGYRLEPLTEEQSRNPRAQKMWQLLASLAGEPQNPMYPDVSLVGELFGTSGDDDALTDELLVRVFRLVRLVRVLRHELAMTKEGD